MEMSKELVQFLTWMSKAFKEEKSNIDLSGRKKKKKEKAKRSCFKCGKTYRLQRHHVTYEPEVVKLLCRLCHLKITAMNKAVARSTDPFHTLTNAERLQNWEKFLAKGIK